MGAYDNPTIIQDLYGAKAWAEAAAGVTQTFVQQMAERRKRLDKLQDEANKASNLKSLAFNETALSENEALNSALDIYAEKNQGKNQTIIEQGRIIGEDLLNGIDGNMGAIEAKTLLRTETGLTKQLRKQYQDIVNVSNNFQSRMKNAAGVIGLDVEVIKGVNPSTVKDYYWQGTNWKERTGSMFSGFALADKYIKGVTSKKTLRHVKGKNDHYQNILSVETKLRRDHKLIKEIAAFQDPDDYKEDENGFITINWERDLNRWGGGVLEELTEGTNYEEINKQTNIITNNKLSKGLEVDLGFTFANQPGTGGREHRKTKTIWMDIDRVERTFLNAPTVKGRIAALQTMEPGELQAYIEQRLEMGAEFNINEFLELSTTDQETALEKMELLAYSRDMGIKMGDNTYGGVEGYNLEYQKLTGDVIEKLGLAGIDTSDMEEWTDDMTEKSNPNAYGYFMNKTSDPQTNPSWIKPGSEEAHNRDSWSKWQKNLKEPSTGWPKNSIFMGEIVPGENKIMKRIIWNSTTGMWMPQRYNASQGRFIGVIQGGAMNKEGTAWIPDGTSTNWSGMEPSKLKSLFKDWLYPSQK
tara:strand:- start:9925 stop:11673 length:1749 start_codon:yes stop_codon:yes gene_type:complete